MNSTLIENHNKVVKNNDTVIHVGDLTLNKNFHKVCYQFVEKLNGTHIFLRGSHDYWMGDKVDVFGKRIHEIFEKKYKKEFIVACHYPMRRWPRSHWGS